MQPVLTLVSGAVAAQAITFIARPFLTRLFTPDEFGVLTLFVALVGAFGVMASGRYEDALMLPEDDGESASLLGLALAFGLGMAGLLALLLPWREPIAALFDSRALAQAMPLLPIAVLGVGWSKTLETWHTRFDRFSGISTSRVAQNIATVGVQLAAGFAGMSALGLVSGATAGFGVLALSLVGLLLLQDRSRLRLVSFSEALRLARRYRRFPLFSAPAALLNTLSRSIPAFLLAPLYGLAAVGLFGQAYGMLALPVGLIAGAVAQVFFVRASEAHRDGVLAPLATRVTRRLIAVTLFPMAAAALAGPELFALVFGEPWREAGVFARLLSPWLLTATVAMPLTRIFDVTEHQRSDFGFSVLLFGVQVVALVSVYLAGGGVRLAIAGISVAGTLSRLAQIGWMLRVAEASRRNALAVLARHAGYALLGLAPAALVMLLGASPLGILLALVVGGLGYAALAVRADQRSA